jgi:battenin
MQLVGVAIGSVQSGFGEASFLAMTTFYAGRSSVTAWSSGTGLAGPFGYLWVIVFVQVFKVDFSVTLLSALVMPVAFWLNYAFLLGSPVITREKAKSIPSVSSGSLSDHSGSGSERHGSHSGELYEASDSPTPKTEESKYKDPSEAILSMTFRERVSRTLDLWPFTVPLFSVYLAEYAMQSGPWAAIGFPIDSKSARDRFYEYSNFAYQGGVLVSRSSGLIYKADMAAIWTMPVLQSIMLGFFIAVAYMQFWYNNWLLIMCFGVGLLGGSVYVGGFSLMRETVAPELKEFSLSAASFADGLGIVIASFIGGAIQKALYNYYDINDSGN